MESIVEKIAGKLCRIWYSKERGPVIYWGVSADAEELEEKVLIRLKKLTNSKAWTLVAYEVDHWNDDFSPWPMPDGREETFAGCAKQTLNWLINECIPSVEKRLPKGVATRLIGGYSLAGLFSLFAFYESGMFSGAASCSGSLWYPGWTEYIPNRQAPKQSVVYLSLGKKEEKTHHPLIAPVGEKTRWQYEQILKDPNIRKSEFVIHNGGHFTEVEMRIAHGFTWLINNGMENNERIPLSIQQDAPQIDE